VEHLEFALRLAVAFLLGSALGFERQWRQRMAGLRTNTLVATGSALFVMLSVLTPDDASPTRISAQVVSGIGFLAGGVILKEGLSVRGLNTAATIWCAAAIGALAGAGFISEAFMGAIAPQHLQVIKRSQSPYIYDFQDHKKPKLYPLLVHLLLISLLRYLLLSNLPQHKFSHF